MTTLQMARSNIIQAGVSFSMSAFKRRRVSWGPISVERPKGTQAKNENAVLKSAIELAETSCQFARHRLAHALLRQ